MGSYPLSNAGADRIRRAKMSLVRDETYGGLKRRQVALRHPDDRRPFHRDCFRRKPHAGWCRGDRRTGDARPEGADTVGALALRRRGGCRRAVGRPEMPASVVALCAPERSAPIFEIDVAVRQAQETKPTVIDQFRPLDTSENLTLSLLPIAVAPVTMRILTKPAMKQYSIAVAPDVSR